MWSPGCILVEFVTGELLFHVHNDFDHLYMIEKLCFSYPIWMVESCCKEFRRLFDKHGNIDYHYGDRLVENMSEVVGLERLHNTLSGQPELRSLVEKCLEIDPRKRISCN